jgi:predicted RNase H-like nuclease (RuvC/YqgF family)
MEDLEEDEDEVLPLGNWEGITLEDYDMLYRLLHSEYRDFDKCHRANQCTVQGLEMKLKGLHSRIQELEAEIDELKALDKEELKKLAKAEEVQALQGNVRDLKGKLDFERGQWTELHENYKALLDRFFVLDHCEGISVAKQIRKRLDDHLDEEFQKRVSMEVTRRVLDIMGDTDMERKLASMDVDDQFNERVLKEALKRYQDMVEWFQKDRNPNLEQISSWLNWTFNTVSREKCLKQAWKALAIHMVISSEGCENIKCSLAFVRQGQRREDRSSTPHHVLG